MGQYVFRCDTHGDRELDLPADLATRPVICQECENARIAAGLARENAPRSEADVAATRMRRVYTPPTIGLESYGRNFGVPRRPFWKMKVHREMDAVKQRDASREAGAVRQWGAGSRTTGT